jgi:hypothetical protein
MRPVIALTALATLTNLAALAACAPAHPRPGDLRTAADTTAYVASLAQAERRARKIRIHEEYDRFTGRTVVSMPLIDDGLFSSSTSRVVVSFSRPADSTASEPPAEVLFIVDWEDFGVSTRLVETPTADFLVDDSVRFSAKGRDYESYVDRSVLQAVFDDSTFRQRVVLPVAREDFARMTSARIVEARVPGGATFVLRPEHLIALRRLEERME